MNESMQRDAGGAILDMLIEWLGVKDPQKNETASAVLCRLGGEAVPYLIQQAIGPGKRFQHRIAILDVVQQIGGPLELDDLIRLRLLLGHRSAGVRQKAELVIMAASPQGLPTSPEDAALMRAFNPVLQPLPRWSRRKKSATGLVRLLSLF